jgi:uncharacterized membrane protein
MEYLPLVGVVAVVVGFLLRLRVTVTVVGAGFITGLVAGMPLVGTDAAPGIIDTLGRAFANGRAITLFVLAFAAIGLSERYGLQEQARRVILKIPAATAGRLQLVYQFFRIGMVAMGIRLGSGHVSFSRPLIVPMALGATGLDATRDAETPEADRVKAAAAASDNYGNFFGQNLFFGAAGVALVVSTFKQNGIEVDPRAVSRWTVPILAASVILAAIQYGFLDAWLRKRGPKR